MRLDVFQAKVAAEKNLKDSGEWEKLSPEQQRLVDKMVRQSNHHGGMIKTPCKILDGKRAGLALPEKERTELTQLKKDLSQACLEFSVKQLPLIPTLPADLRPEKLQRRKRHHHLYRRRTQWRPFGCRFWLHQEVGRWERTFGGDIQDS